MIDMREVDVALGIGIIPTPQLDFAHRIIYFLNSTSLNQYNKIRIYLKCKTTYVEVSPMLLVPASLAEFINLLTTCLNGLDVKVDNMRVLTMKKELPQMPKISYAVHPTAQKVADPATIVSNPCIIELSRTPDKLDSEHICFSKYPLDPIAQCGSIVSAFEKHLQIE